MSDGKKNWYALYTKPRWEKKVYARLSEKGMESYCPINKVRRRWSDRIKWIEEPLFRSYVFVKAKEEELTEIRSTSGVVNFVYWLGKPAIVRNRDIEVIRKFLDDHGHVEVIPIGLRNDSQVTILKGALRDRKAKVVKVLKNKVQVIIESIGYSLVAVIDKSNTAIVEKE